MVSGSRVVKTRSPGSFVHTGQLLRAGIPISPHLVFVKPAVFSDVVQIKPLVEPLRITPPDSLQHLVHALLRPLIEREESRSVFSLSAHPPDAPSCAGPVFEVEICET